MMKMFSKNAHIFDVMVGDVIRYAPFDTDTLIEAPILHINRFDCTLLTLGTSGRSFDIGIPKEDGIDILSRPSTLVLPETTELHHILLKKVKEVTDMEVDLPRVVYWNANAWYDSIDCFHFVVHQENVLEWEELVLPTKVGSRIEIYPEKDSVLYGRDDEDDPPFILQENGEWFSRSLDEPQILTSEEVETMPWMPLDYVEVVGVEGAQIRIKEDIYSRKEDTVVVSWDEKRQAWRSFDSDVPVYYPPYIIIKWENVSVVTETKTPWLDIV